MPLEIEINEFPEHIGELIRVVEPILPDIDHPHLLTDRVAEGQCMCWLAAAGAPRPLNGLKPKYWQPVSNFTFSLLSLVLFQLKNHQQEPGFAFDHVCIHVQKVVFYCLCMFEPQWPSAHPESDRPSRQAQLRATMTAPDTWVHQPIEKRIFLEAGGLIHALNMKTFECWIRSVNARVPCKDVDVLLRDVTKYLDEVTESLDHESDDECDDDSSDKAFMESEWPAPPWGH